ncbi:MAG TPA: PAS domain S-box protein, partial [Actinomycetota bacterium]|nr:PAS domain S-box protein [Actinomycetota bacterium]
MAIAGTESSALDQLDAAVVITDLDGTVDYWNRRATELYGWTREEATGRNVVDLLAPVSNPEAAGRITELLVSGQKWEGDLEVRRKDGTTVLVHVSDSLLYDRAGAPTGIVGLSFDVTERWRTERRLAVQYGVARALAEADSLGDAAPEVLRAICASVGWQFGALWILDQAARVLRCVDVWRAE